MKKIKENRYFKAYEISDSSIAIEGMGGELCYLLKGNEQALLIDALCGEGSLKTFVGELTELPVTVALTHGHLDHVGGAYEYGECLIHPADIGALYTEHTFGKPDRRQFAASFSGAQHEDLTEDEMVPGSVMKTYPIMDGNVIKLGSKDVLVIGVPGHTRGTVVFLDIKERILYSGDACNVNTLLDLTGATTVEEYEESLRHLKEFQKDFDGMYGGHGLNLVPGVIVDEGLDLCAAIMERKDAAVVTPAFDGSISLVAKERIPGVCQNADGTICNIAYKEDRIFKKEVWYDDTLPVPVEVKTV